MKGESMEYQILTVASFKGLHSWSNTLPFNIMALEGFRNSSSVAVSILKGTPWRKERVFHNNIFVVLF